MFQHPLFSFGRVDLHPLFNVQFIKAESCHTAFRWPLADVLYKLRHSRKVWQFVRIMDEVPKGDQRMGLASAVGKLELSNGLVILASQPQDNVPHEVAKVICRKCEGEEFFWVLVDRALAALHQNFIEVGGEQVQRQLS
jgi:hypothetical protein